MNATTYGLDISKCVFQLYWVDKSAGQIFNQRFDRGALIDFLSNRPSGLGALEACGSGQWWARKIELLGHRATLLDPKFLRPFVQTNKTDASDARAIWTAVNQPGMRTVAVKTEDQQAVLGLHRIRSQLVKVRTTQVNQLRGLLYEFGISVKGGRQAGLAEIRQRICELDESVPGLLMSALQDSLQRLSLLDEDIRKIERRIAAWMKEQAACRAIAEIPGVGTLAVTALVATIG